MLFSEFAGDVHGASTQEAPHSVAVMDASHGSLGGTGVGVGLEQVVSDIQRIADRVLGKAVDAHEPLVSAGMKGEG